MPQVPLARNYLIKKYGAAKSGLLYTAVQHFHGMPVSLSGFISCFCS